MHTNFNVSNKHLSSLIKIFYVLLLKHEKMTFLRQPMVQQSATSMTFQSLLIR